MNLRLTIMTCDGREKALARTLRSAYDSDLATQPVVYHDTTRHENRRISQVTTAHHILNDSLPREWDYLVFCEDDVNFNRHFLHNLTSWSQLPTLKLGTLYTSERAKEGDTLWQDPMFIGGSQCVVIAKAFLPHVLGQWHNYDADVMQDLRMFRSLKGVGLVPSHMPSLVQHRACGSTWGGQYHFSPTFQVNYRTSNVNL